MEWKIEDSAPHWLKVRSEAGRIYFVLWEHDPVFIAMEVLPLIPADPLESRKFVVPLTREEMPRPAGKEADSTVIWDPSLIKLWRDERRKCELAGILSPSSWRDNIRPPGTATVLPRPPPHSEHSPEPPPHPASGPNYA